VPYDDWRRNPAPARYDRGYGSWWEREPGRPRQARPASGYELEYGFERPALHGPARYGLGPYHERLRRRRRPDEELRQDVEDALFYDTWVDADAITVEVSDGVVTLKGELPSFEEVRFATDDAWDIEGVVGVRTELRVVYR
jgi:hypothetical protein